LLSRIVLADVAGHGQAVSATAATLGNLLRKHMNILDQSVLLQEMDAAFCREDDREEVQCATAAVFSNFRKTRDLIFTDAGHPFALWHDATENTWDWLNNKTPYRQATVEVIPLGTDRELTSIHSSVLLLQLVTFPRSTSPMGVHRERVLLKRCSPASARLSMRANRLLKTPRVVAEVEEPPTRLDDSARPYAISKALP
jgi:hypothetical protein